MRKEHFKYLIFLLMLTQATVLPAQETVQDSSSQSGLRERVFYGGSIGLHLGRYYDQFDVQPYIASRLGKQFYLGTGLSYSYMSYTAELDNSYILFEDNYLGASLFAGYFLKSERYPVLNRMYLQVEYEYLWSYLSGDERNEAFSDSHLLPFAGIGYKTKLGKRLKLNAYVGMVLSSSEDIPYRNPVISIGLEL